MERDHPSDPPSAVRARHLARVPLPYDDDSSSSWPAAAPTPRHRGRPLPCARAQVVLAGLLASAALVSAACSGNHHPVTTPSTAGPVTRGMASWYGSKFDGRRTANGERYDMRQLTAAHPTLPFGTLVQVTNVENGRQVVVRINDRGPFGRRRVIDLSYAAARELRMVGPGTARVELAVLGRFDSMAPASPAQPMLLAAAAVPAAPDAAPPGTPTAAAAPAIDAYTVQVGAFGEAERAEALQRDLAGRYPAAVVLSDGTWSRVQVGRFGDREEAETLRAELASSGLAAIVVAAR
ncbi:MAG TPA: septal ring lytic transglycosylase RlpA family protein [Thermoanaerobaculia bacterium]|nr:septal ring lytic transglycosylase RlpA family protein [Thermoanaerobaculia bacterium]